MARLSLPQFWMWAALLTGATEKSSKVTDPDAMKAMLMGMMQAKRK